jgi:hypothetical protein
MEALRRTSRTTILVVTAAIDIVALACGYWLVAGGDDEIVGWIIVSVVGTVIAAALLLRFVPATESEADGNAPARRGLVLAVVALVTCLVFWTGLPIVIGISALVLAAEGRARAATQDHGSEATAAAVIAAFAALATTILLVTAT